ncbi:MAG: AAA family ATPase, partial [Burkholderiales bacterium]|nr:AAA family ATPase [Burkholderiales bacterium]
MATNLPAPAAALLNEIEAWAEAGVLRRLDAAFAAFALELDPSAAPETVLAAALVAHLEGLGHGCLDLDDLLADGAALLGWAAPAAVRLQATLRALPRSADAWRAVLRSSPLVALDEPGAAGASGSPLVLRGSRLYLRRLWACERVIAEQVHARNAGTEAVDTAAARHWLDRLFAPAPPSAEAAFDWQKAACAIALRGRLTVVTGGPGTGKTHTAARLLALLFALEADPARLRVALAAPTGKAAGRLEQSIRHALAELGPALEGHALGAAGLAARIGSARTLHALLGARPDTRRFAFDAANPLPLDLLLVDEASMIHLEMMAALLAALAPGARLVLLGDRDQLASV